MIEMRVIKSDSHVFFLERPKTGKTSQWYVVFEDPTDWEEVKEDFILGEVKWYSPWRKYTLYTINEHAIFDSICLSAIVKFMDDETKKHKQKLKELKYGMHFL